MLVLLSSFFFNVCPIEGPIVVSALLSARRQVGSRLRSNRRPPVHGWARHCSLISFSFKNWLQIHCPVKIYVSVPGTSSKQCRSYSWSEYSAPRPYISSVSNCVVSKDACAGLELFYSGLKRISCSPVRGCILTARNKRFCFVESGSLPFVVLATICAFVALDCRIGKFLIYTFHNFQICSLTSLT